MMRGRALILLFGIFMGLAGCSKEKGLGEFDASEIKPLRVTDSLQTLTNSASGRAMGRDVPQGVDQTQVNVVAGGQNYKNSDWTSAGITDTVQRAPGFRGPDADYIDKADVYWKLNWIRKKLQNGNLPSNLKEAVKTTRKLLMTVVRDRNFDTADQAVTALEEGIEHIDAQQTLKLGNVDPQLVPWGAGREAVTRYFNKDKNRPNSNKFVHQSNETSLLNSTDDLLTSRYSRLGHHATVIPGVKEAQAMAISYAAKYAASPEEMMRRSWQKAIEKTNKLRDDLGLMNRADNSDRNDISVPTVFGTTHEAESPSGEFDNPSDHVVPVPSIQGNVSRPNVPASTYKEPDNPFAKS